MEKKQVSLKEGLRRFQEIAKKQEIDFMVCGSYALEMHGLKLGREPHDLDIEVKSNGNFDMLHKMFSMLADVYGNDYYKNNEYDKDANKPYIYEIDGVLINVWIVREFTHQGSYMMKYEMKFAGIESILREKMKIGRKKDYIDVISIAQNLFNIALNQAVLNDNLPKGTVEIAKNCNCETCKKSI